MDLSKRLYAVANLVTPCHTMADIGCDHGYVSLYLIQEQICNKMIAMDINKGPLEKAVQHIEQADLQHLIETRLSNGAKMLQQGEADGLICAGMGGRLTVSILETSLEKVRSMSQLILQPQSELWLVRQYLKKIGFFIDKEDIIFEDGKYYPMMHAVPIDSSKGTNDNLKNEQCFWENTSLEDRFGPCLLKEQSPVFIEFLNKELDKYCEILDKLSITGQAEIRLQEISSEVEAIHAALSYDR